MPVNAELKTLLASLTKEVQQNGKSASDMAIQTKREYGKLQNALLLNPHQVDEIIFGRDLYEQCAFLAVKQNDLEAFERQVKQLKVYYRDFTLLLKGQQSPNEHKIMGLYLLYLLASDRIGEFHTELELIGSHDNQFIQNPMLLERALMEGNYASINKSIKQLESQEHYKLFLEMLLQTMRRRIADALARSSHEVTIDFAVKMLYLGSAAELKTFIEKHQAETADMSDASGAGADKWVVDEKSKKLLFREATEVEKVTTYDTISNVIGYATEIERIV